MSAKQITLLDGGMGQELVHRAGDKPTPLWSTQVMMDMPGLVAEVHADYAKSGARVATTNTYAIHRDRLRGGSNHYAADGLVMDDLEDQFFDLLDAALNEADKVRDRCTIAGSVGPLGASYRADLHPDVETATALYAEVARHIAPRVDVLLFETLPSITAVQAALAAGRQTDKPVWLALTVNDSDGSLLRSGEAVRDAADYAAGADAILINCSVPEVVADALDALSQTGTPLGAYANGFTKIEDDFINGGTTVASLSARKDLSPETYAAHALKWVDHGAPILGGCCEVGPAHIQEMARHLKSAGHVLV